MSKINALVKKTYKTSPVKKMKRSEFDKLVRVAYHIAVIDVANAVSVDHRTEPFKTPEEIIGKLSILSQASEKKLNANANGFYSIPKQLEDYT